MIRIIHLSDLHLEKENPNLKQSNLLQALMSDIKGYVNDEIIIIFSGDLIDKSGLAFSDKNSRFKTFEEKFLNKLNKLYPETNGRIFIVPGNHDFDRDKIDKYSSIPFRDNLVSNPNIVNEYIQDVKDRKREIEGLIEYKEFEKSFYNKSYDNTNWLWSELDSSHTIVADGKKIGISALNSSWLCYEDENIEKLFIGEKQIEDSFSFIQDCDIKIAIMHHPFEFYHRSDLDKIKPILYNNYDMVFVGHTHKLESKQIDDLDGNLFVSIGKSISGEDTKNTDYINGYSIIDYFPNDKISVTYKKYLSNKNSFVINTDIGNDLGLKEFQIPRTAELETFNKARAIINTIKSDHYPKLNNDLILNISQSNKSSLAEIFVEPIIGNFPESNLNDQEEIEYFDSKMFSTSNNNHIIFGAKETGKTILLNKILIDFTENYSKNHRIAVLLKFSELGNRSIEQIIKEFILKSSEETRLILSNVKITLLIDDIDFNSDYKFQLKELKNFIEDYPSTNLITTHIHSNESQIPIKSIDEFSKYVSEFEISYLHFFKSKQIKGLISNWVTTNELDVHQNIEKLLKGFTELGLPKTPLAVTLFLWIINKQEKKPINNAVLVELFIANLLEKNDIKNIYFDTFDFDDKQRLLAYISKFMLSQGDKNFNYRVNEFELLKYIETYLELKIDINPNKVFNYFLDKGVLVRCNGNSIKFKAAFFFSYFIAKYMGFDYDFKDKVFSNNNYLDFLNEIDFYTGLNREDTKVFDFINKELIDVFSFINPTVRNDHNNVDKFLETKKTISSQIDLDRANSKPTEKELEEAYDSQISSVKPVQKITPKKDLYKDTEEDQKKIDSPPPFSKVLKIAAIILKNSTDINAQKRKESYDNIVLSSISFMLIYRETVLQYHKKNLKEVENFLPKKMDFGFFMQVLPIIHQVTIYNWLGSLKTAPIIRAKILEDQTSVNISEFEKFLSVYIYSDIRGKDYVTYINENFKNSKKKYILDGIFIKNMSYYYLRSKTPESDKRNRKLLADIKVKLRGLSKHGKGEFIQKLKEEKRSKE